ncbi:MAG TPA: hypothetical protein VFS36_05065 [Chitinophagaceae bacterium]|jgi:hypothetical protein|nr:hypothetical protein [Chitinophagaceae bacterium]
MRKKRNIQLSIMLLTVTLAFIFLYAFTPSRFIAHTTHNESMDDCCKNSHSTPHPGATLWEGLTGQFFSSTGILD